MSGDVSVKSLVESVFKVVKHGGGSVMVCGCISGDDKGMIVDVKGRMDRFQYLEILENAVTISMGSKRSGLHIYA